MTKDTMIDVTVLDKNSASYKPRATKLARRLMQEFDRVDCTLEIFIVGDKEMPKNVLSFPADPSFPRPDLKQPPLGEIYLNPSFIAREELEIGNWKLEIPAKFDYMLIHGFLHLLGYDHIKKSDRIAMERKERQLLKQLRVTRNA